MKLSVKKADYNFKDLEKIDRLNKEAFPQQERIELDFILEFVEQGNMECLAFYDEDEFIGFMTVMYSENLVYISFFAIEPTKRSKGYGSKILTIIKEYYETKNIIIDIEPLDENAENYEQRVTRKGFYERNGFFSSGYSWSYSGMTFEFVCNKIFLKDEFVNMVEQFRSEEFDPVVFEN